MCAKDILNEKGNHVHAIHEKEPTATAVGLLDSYNIGALIVYDDEGRMTGILSERDVIRCLAANGSQVLKQEIRGVMQEQVQVCKPNTDIYDLMQRMTGARIRHLPVMEGEQLLGIVSIGDVMKRRMEEMATETNALRDRLISR